MDWVKSFFGILLFLASLYYLKNVVPALAHFTSPSPGFALAMAAMIAGRPRAGRDSHDLPRRRAREGAQGLRRRPGRRRVCSARSTTRSRPRATIQLAWLTDEAAALAQARAAGRPVLVDFSADWCTPCKELDVKVFSKREVAEVMTRFTLLRVDLSKANDEPALGEIKSTLRRRDPTGRPHRLARRKVPRQDRRRRTAPRRPLPREAGRRPAPRTRTRGGT